MVGKFGMGLPVVQQVPGRAQAWEATAGVAEIVRVAQAADRLGFAWITCSDHIAVPASYAKAMGAIWYDPATTLAYLAAVTKRVGLLSHVVVLPYRHPLAVAKQYATLDRLSAGRLILGVGSGHLKPEFTSLGANYVERGMVSDEYLNALAVALTDEVSSFDGRYVRWRYLLVAPRPVQAPRPPIWVGGNNRPAARRAARHADGWIPWDIPLDEFRHRVAEIRGVREEGGRPAECELIAPLPVGRDMSPAAIAELVGTWHGAGATAFHVGFASTSVDHLLDRMAMFAEVASDR